MSLHRTLWKRTTRRFQPRWAQTQIVVIRLCDRLQKSSLLGSGTTFWGSNSYLSNFIAWEWETNDSRRDISLHAQAKKGIWVPLPFLSGSVLKKIIACLCLIISHSVAFCNDLEIDCLCTDQETCCAWLKFLQPRSFSVWSTATYFYLNDERPNGFGTAHVDTELLGFNYYFIPCMSFGLCGIHENSFGKTPLLGATTSLPSRAFTHTEGWGGSVYMNYIVTPVLNAYVNYAYVTIHQGITSKFFTGGVALQDTVSSARGYRWNLMGGLSAACPLNYMLFIFDLNYLYISNHMGGMRWCGVVGQIWTRFK